MWYDDALSSKKLHPSTNNVEREDPFLYLDAKNPPSPSVSCATLALEAPLPFSFNRDVFGATENSDALTYDIAPATEGAGLGGCHPWQRAASSEFDGR